MEPAVDVSGVGHRLLVRGGPGVLLGPRRVLVEGDGRLRHGLVGQRPQRPDDEVLRGVDRLVDAEQLLGLEETDVL